MTLASTAPHACGILVLPPSLGRSGDRSGTGWNWGTAKGKAFYHSTASMVNPLGKHWWDWRFIDWGNIDGIDGIDVASSGLTIWNITRVHSFLLNIIMGKHDETSTVYISRCTVHMAQECYSLFSQQHLLPKHSNIGQTLSSRNFWCILIQNKRPNRVCVWYLKL